MQTSEVVRGPFRWEGGKRKEPLTTSNVWESG